MDEGHDKIEQLLVTAAAIMEDASAALLDLRGQSLAARVALLRSTGVAIASLGQAATALLSISNDGAA